MFEPIVIAEFGRCAPDVATVERMRTVMRGFIFTYVDQIRSGSPPSTASPSARLRQRRQRPCLHDPELVAASEAFLAGRAQTARSESRGAAHAPLRAGARALLCRARSRGGRPAAQPHARRADTTVRIELADDPDLSVSLLLDREPIEVVDDAGGEVELSIASVDLDRLCSPDFHLAMAIARGRVQYTAPCASSCACRRRAPRVAAVAGRGLRARHRSQLRMSMLDTDSVNGDSKFSPETQQLLDRAAGYEHTKGTWDFPEDKPGEFWSIKVENCYKSFAATS